MQDIESETSSNITEDNKSECMQQETNISRSFQYEKPIPRQKAFCSKEMFSLEIMPNIIDLLQQ